MWSESVTLESCQVARTISLSRRSSADKYWRLRPSTDTHTHTQRDTHTHTHKHPPTHPPTHAPTHARTHTCTHPRTNARTPTQHACPPARPNASQPARSHIHTRAQARMQARWHAHTHACTVQRMCPLCAITMLRTGSATEWCRMILEPMPAVWTACKAKSRLSWMPFAKRIASAQEVSASRTTSCFMI